MALAPVHIASHGDREDRSRASRTWRCSCGCSRARDGAGDHGLHVALPRSARRGELHIVLVDNGRTRQLAREEFWRSLKCIRCGACMNTCPVYRRSGGHSYGYDRSGADRLGARAGARSERVRIAAVRVHAVRLVHRRVPGEDRPRRTALPLAAARRRSGARARHEVRRDEVVGAAVQSSAAVPRRGRARAARTPHPPRAALATGGATVGARARAAGPAGAELSRVVPKESAREAGDEPRVGERTRRHPRRRSRRTSAGGGVGRSRSGPRRTGRAACRARIRSPPRRRLPARPSTPAARSDVARVIAGATDGAASVLSYAAGVTSTMKFHGDAHVLDTLDVLVCESSLGVAENGAVWIATSDTLLRGALFLAARVVIVVRETELVDDLHEAYERIDVREPFVRRVHRRSVEDGRHRAGARHRRARTEGADAGARARGRPRESLTMRTR